MLYRFRNKARVLVEKRQFSYPLSFSLHNHLRFFSWISGNGREPLTAGVLYLYWRDQDCIPGWKADDNDKDWISGGSKFYSRMVRWKKREFVHCNGMKVAGCLHEREGLARDGQEK